MTAQTRPRPDAATAPGASTALAWGIVASLAFTALIWVLNPLLADVVLLPDQGAAWYYWKLPEPTWITRVSAWLPYLLHQAAIWWLIASAQRQRPRYTAGLHWFNKAALAVNAGFILLHVLQTHLFYDGLAQDVSVFSSQASVVLLLIMVLLMEAPRRGLFFGHRAGVPRTSVNVVKRYHGYVFAWATIYTFWFHPTVSSPGHLVGFVYMFLLLLQGSLFFTRAHLNRTWTTTLEVLVLAHGALIAYGQGNGIWPMFAFGFGAIFIATQMYGLGWPRWARWTAIGVFVALVTWVYAGRGWRVDEVLRIPVIEYGLVFVLVGLIELGRRIARRRGRSGRPTEGSQEVAA